MDNNVKHTLVQAALGEFACERDRAATMTADEFALFHNTITRLWGTGGVYTAVRVDGADYLWNTQTGEYDGWDRPMCKE